MIDWKAEALTVIREGLPALPSHPIRGRLIPVARWQRDSFAAVWLIKRRKKIYFDQLLFASYFGSAGWSEPMGGGGGGCPPFVDEVTREWKRPTEDPWIGRNAYLVPAGMSRAPFDAFEVAAYSLRTWAVCALEGVDAVRVEIDGGETYTEPVTSPLGSLIIGISDEWPSARLIPLDEKGRDFAGWFAAV